MYANHSGSQANSTRLYLEILLILYPLILASHATVNAVRAIQDKQALVVGISHDLSTIRQAVDGYLVAVMQSRLAEADPAREVAHHDAGVAVSTDVTAPAPDSSKVIDSERDPGLLSPDYPFDYAAYLDRLDNRRVSWSQRKMQEFFDNNAAREGVVSLPVGMQYKILRAGQGPSPGPADSVTFDYRVYLSDGTELYSSLDEAEPAAFSMGEVVPALKEVFPRMKAGAIWELYVPPALAHSGAARKRIRMAFEPHIYVLELRSVSPAGTER
jgi:hypothetical protein